MTEQDEQKELEYTLKLGGSPYGFGRNWSLVIQEEDSGETVKSLFLGQDAKVMSRLLGKAVDDYEQKYDTRDFSELKEHIARDIIYALQGSTEEITQETLQDLANMKGWEIAVE